MTSRDSRELLLDSHAWIDIFRDSKAGRRVKDYIKGKKKHTSAINIAEVERKIRREGDKKDLEKARELFVFCNIINVTKEIAELAAELSVKHKLHLADALVYACARFHKLEVCTGDPDLKGLKGVKYFGK